MPGTNRPVGRTNTSAFGGVYWHKRFSPMQPDVASWTEDQFLGAPFPFEYPPQAVVLDAIASEEVVADIAASSIIALDAIASEEVVSDLAIESGVTLDSIASEEAVGDMTVGQEVYLDAIASEEAVGEPTIEIVEPVDVSVDGGEAIEFHQLVLPTGTYRIHVGPNENETDPVLYSGIQGQGSRIDVADGAFTGILPPLPVGGPYRFYLVKLSGTEDATFLSAQAVTVRPAELRSGRFGLRRLLVPTFATGPRRIEDVPYPQ